MARRIAIVGLALVSLLVVPGIAVAQQATPAVTPDIPRPEECTVAPRTVAELQTLFATPVTPTPPASPSPTGLPTGTPVDAATAAAVKAAIREFIACFNAGDFWRQMATYSDRFVQVYLQTYISPGTGVTQEIYDYYATPQPAPTQHRTALLAVDNIVRIPDGRVAAVVVAQDPASKVAPGRTIVYLVNNGSRWQIDAFVYMQSGG